MIFLGELMTKASQCGFDGWRAILGLSLACAIVGSWGLPRCIAQEPLPGEDPDLKEIVSAASDFDISIGADNLPLEFKKIPVLRWPNATRLPAKRLTRLLVLRNPIEKYSPRRTMDNYSLDRFLRYSRTASASSFPW